MKADRPPSGKMRLNFGLVCSPRFAFDGGMTANPIKWRLHWQILLSLSLAVMLGVLILPNPGEGFGGAFIGFSKFIGMLSWFFITVMRIAN